MAFVLHEVQFLSLVDAMLCVTESNLSPLSPLSHRVMFLRFPFATNKIGKENLVTCIILSTTGLSLSLLVWYLVENFFWQKPNMMSVFRDGKRDKLYSLHELALVKPNAISHDVKPIFLVIHVQLLQEPAPWARQTDGHI